MAHLDAQNVVTRRKQRQVWPDSVKGICIALVVLLHVVSKHYASLDWPMPSVLAIGWEGISSVMEPIRMPLFFAISGYFSATYLAKPWGYVARKRIIPIFILYVLWLMLDSFFYLFIENPPTLTVDGITGFLLAIVLGYTSLWYLYALPVYLMLAKLCARMPRSALIVAVALSILSATTLFPEIGNSPSLIRNFVYFLAGMLLTQHFARLAEQRIGWRLAAWSALFVIVSSVHSYGRYATEPGNLAVDLALAVVQMMASVVGVIVGIGLVAALARWQPRPFAGLAWLGQRTLPIYVLHLPLIAMLNIAMNETSLPLPLIAIYPALATAVLVFACVGLSALITACRGGWLFDTKALTRLAERPRT